MVIGDEKGEVERGDDGWDVHARGSVWVGVNYPFRSILGVGRWQRWCIGGAPVSWLSSNLIYEGGLRTTG